MSSLPDAGRINAIILVILLPAQHLSKWWLSLESPDGSLAFHSPALDINQTALLPSMMMVHTALHTNPRSRFLFDSKPRPIHTPECKRENVRFPSEDVSTSRCSRIAHSFPLLTSPLVSKSFCLFFLNPNLYFAGRTTWYRVNHFANAFSVPVLKWFTLQAPNSSSASASVRRSLTISTDNSGMIN